MEAYYYFEQAQLFLYKLKVFIFFILLITQHAPWQTAIPSRETLFHIQALNYFLAACFNVVFCKICLNQIFLPDFIRIPLTQKIGLKRPKGSILQYLCLLTQNLRLFVRISDSSLQPEFSDKLIIPSGSKSQNIIIFSL